MMPLDMQPAGCIFAFMSHRSTKWAYFLVGLKASIEGDTATPYPEDLRISSWGQHARRHGANRGREMINDVFRALADPSRRRLLDRLNQRGGQSLRELCDGWQ
jgi:hypothetical protein